MGEQSISFASGHIWSPIMRSSRGKLFVYLTVLGAMCFIVFLLSSAHSSLKQLESANEKCQQQRDSLSAQLQVVYEHKNRLEKSLQQEKSDHKHTKEDIKKQLQEEESKVQQEKEKEHALESQISQLKSNYAELEEEKKHAEDTMREQLQSLQSQKDKEIKQLQAQITELLSDKDKLEQSKNALAWKVEQHLNEANLYQLQYQQVNQKFRECNDQLLKKKEPAPENSEIMNEAQNLFKKSEVAPAPLAIHEKLNVLVRPHIQKPNEENKVEDLPSQTSKSEIKSSVAADVQKNKGNDSHEEHEQVPPPFSDPNNIKEDAKQKEHSINEIQSELGKGQDAVNNPQVQPPNAVEKGEYGNGMEQLEQPQFRGSNSDLKKSNVQAQNMIDVKAAQVRDMLDKSPADANDGYEARHISPLQDFGALKLNDLQQNIKPHAELPVGDKHYAEEDDEDQDGENEDDPIGGMQGAHGKGFPPQDFDEREPNDNREGVMLAPR